MSEATRAFLLRVAGPRVEKLESGDIIDALESLEGFREWSVMLEEEAPRGHFVDDVGDGYPGWVNDE